MEVLRTLCILACLYIHALAAAMSPPDAGALIPTPGSEHTVTLAGTFSDHVVHDTNNKNVSNTTSTLYLDAPSAPKSPIWVYPMGKDLRLKFEKFTIMTAAQQRFSRDLISVVIRASQSYDRYEILASGERYLWGTEKTMELGVYVARDAGRGRMTWGDVTDIARAIQDFLQLYPSWDFWVVIYTRRTPLTKKGDFLLATRLQSQIL